MGDEEITKSLGKLLGAVRDHSEVLVGKGQVDVNELVLSLPARRVVARQLSNVGLSQKEIAKSLNVSPDAIHRDLHLEKTRNASRKTRNADDPNAEANNVPIEDRAEPYYVGEIVGRALKLLAKMNPLEKKEFFKQAREYKI